MSANLLQLQLEQVGAHAGRREPVDSAVLEVSGRLASLNSEKRRLFSRLDELRSADPALRRRRARPLPPDPLRPLTIFSIEEAAPEPSARQVRRA